MTVQIIRGVRINEGQIIRAILYPQLSSTIDFHRAEYENYGCTLSFRLDSYILTVASLCFDLFGGEKRQEALVDPVFPVERGSLRFETFIPQTKELGSLGLVHIAIAKAMSLKLGS